MAKQRPDTDEKTFNETLKRMLETPPKPHDGTKPKEGDSKDDEQTN